jgi:hypothetical protein
MDLHGMVTVLPRPTPHCGATPPKGAFNGSRAESPCRVRLQRQWPGQLGLHPVRRALQFRPAIPRASGSPMLARAPSPLVARAGSGFVVRLLTTVSVSDS